jgi:hypothetical protein
MTKLGVLRRDHAAIGEFVEAVNKSLQPIEPSESRLGIVSTHMLVSASQVSIRAGNSTRYAMCGAYFVKHFAGRPRPSVLYVFEAPPEAFGGAGFRRHIQEILIGSCVLDAS